MRHWHWRTLHNDQASKQGLLSIVVSLLNVSIPVIRQGKIESLDKSKDIWKLRLLCMDHWTKWLYSELVWTLKRSRWSNKNKFMHTSKPSIQKRQSSVDCASVSFSSSSSALSIREDLQKRFRRRFRTLTSRSAKKTCISHRCPESSHDSKYIFWYETRCR